jgi:tetratricopeptide (TPR) repeat protein
LKLIYEKWLYFLLSLIRGIAGIYFLTRVESVVGVSSSSMPFFTRLFVGFYTYIVYLIKSVVPYEMVPVYPYPATFGLKYYLIVLPVIFILTLTYYLFRKENKIVVFGILFFTLNIMFLLQIIGSGQGYLADRYTYIAYLGLFLIYAFGLQFVLEKYGLFDKFIYTAAVIILCLFGYANFKQNMIWKNGETLWSHQIENYKDFSRAWGKRAEYYWDKKDLEKALHDYNKAIAINPKPTHYNGRGLIFLNSNDRSKLILAAKDFSRAIELSIKLSNYGVYTDNYYINRGITYSKLAMPDKALQDFHEAFQLDPLNNDIYYNRSQIYISQKKYDNAQVDLETYVRLNPYYSNMWSNLGEVRRLNKQYGKALNAFTKAIAMDPDNLNTYYLRMKTYFEMGNIEQARKELNFLQTKGFENIHPNYERVLEGDM